MKGPAHYQALLRERTIIPSWMLAHLRGEVESPGVTEVRALLDRSPLDVVSAFPVGKHQFAQTRWEMEVGIRFQGDRTETPFRVWLAPGEPIPEYVVDAGYLTGAQYDEGQRSRWILGLSVHLGKDPLRGFHRQVQVLAVIAPEVVVVYDVQAWWVHPGDWARDIAAAAVPPDPANLFRVDTVSGGSEHPGKAWMHTHGLIRCGSVELEIPNIQEHETEDLGSLLDAVATRFLTEGVPDPDTVFRIGKHLDLVWLPWEEALKKIPQGIPGGRADRDKTHSHPSAVLFCPRRGLFGTRYESLSAYLPVLSDNPVFFVPDAETDRLRLMAWERLPHFRHLLARYGGNADWKFLIKLGLREDRASAEHEREHLWFEVHALQGERVEATLLNEPLSVSRLTQGQRGTHSLDHLTDWKIFSPHGEAGPDGVLRLERAARAAATDG